MGEARANTLYNKTELVKKKQLKNLAAAIKNDVKT